jgi:hypothetical protein
MVLEVKHWGTVEEFSMARYSEYRTWEDDEYVRSLVEFQIFLIWGVIIPHTLAYLLYDSGSHFN